MSKYNNVEKNTLSTDFYFLNFSSKRIYEYIKTRIISSKFIKNKKSLKDKSVKALNR